MKKHDVAKKMIEEKKPRLHYGSVNFTASNPSYKKSQKGRGSLERAPGGRNMGSTMVLGRNEQARA
jgi:hypothetical protein